MNALQKKYQTQIEEIVRTANKAAAIAFVSSHGGNMSLRADASTVVITPTKVAKGSVAFDDVCLIGLDGHILFANPGRKPTGEWPFHVGIMKRRPDVKGIVHAHPPYLTGFAIANSDWLRRPILPEPIMEVGPMLTVAYDAPLSDALAANFDPVIEYSNGFLMKNHGALMVSPEGAWRALELLEMMESAAQGIVVASILGRPDTLSLEEVVRLEEVMKARNMPMPGLPGTVRSLADIYKGEK